MDDKTRNLFVKTATGQGTCGKVVSDNGTIVKYCVLEKDHLGSCSCYERKPQCDSRNRNGVACGQPKGHYGRHSSGFISWENDAED